MAEGGGRRDGPANQRSMTPTERAGGFWYRAENWKLICVFRSERGWLGVSVLPFDPTKAEAVTDVCRSSSQEGCAVAH